MIRAVYRRTAAGAGRLYLCGHAGYAPSGQDIVCAAVSTLYELLRGSLAEAGELEQCRELEQGCTVGGAGPCAEVLFPAVWRTLTALACRYPQYVRTVGEGPAPPPQGHPD